jgi:hypothetical protein
MRFAKPFCLAFALSLVAFAAAPARQVIDPVSGAITFDTNGDGKDDSFYVIRDQNGNIVGF